jgi:hypothetical protein
MLLVWLFGLAIGVANACALGPPAHQEKGAAVAGLAATHHDQGDTDPGQVSCLDFCEKSSIGSLTLKLSDDSTVGHGIPVLAPGYSAVTAQREPSPGHLPSLTPHWRSGPPLRIAYQRLAL